MLFRKVFKSFMNTRIARATKRITGYILDDLQSEEFDRVYQEELQKDLQKCRDKNPSVIKREEVEVEVFSQTGTPYSKVYIGWHIYHNSQGKIYLYMLESQERIIMS